MQEAEVQTEMKNRYMPYGYGMAQGKIVVVISEAEVIRRIFKEYLSGDSLKTIAGTLTAERIPYLPDRWEWNKNRVDRILCDKRYLGTDEYEQIIDAAAFRQAQEIKLKRNTQTAYDKETVISPAVVPILCGKCGQPTIRRHDLRSRFLQKHTCENPDCNAEYRITDEKMLLLISTLLHQANLSQPKAEQREIPLEIRRTENEIARMLERPDTDADALKKRILECAALKYKAVSSGQAIYDKLRTDLDKATPSSLYTRKAVMETVKEIVLIDDDTIQLTLLNGQILGKEQINGTSYDGAD